MDAQYCPIHISSRVHSYFCTKFRLIIKIGVRKSLDRIAFGYQTTESQEWGRKVWRETGGLPLSARTMTLSFVTQHPRLF